jgi:adenosylcobinamide-GDP ribazoletransferase
MKSLLAAIQFLTILPLPFRFQSGEKEMKQSIRFFPIIGLLLGGVLSLLAWCFSWLLAPLPASTCTVILMLAVSGCLHIDGLADTADGMLSSRPRERILEIMKDSRTGAMGVIAVVCIVILKIAALASAPPNLYLGAVFLMPLAGRCALVISSAILPYARPQGGLASAFNRPRRHVLVATLLLLFIAAWPAMKGAGLAAAALTVFITLGFSLYCYRKIGGFTGDTLGAACEIAEILPALMAASWRWPQ